MKLLFINPSSVDNLAEYDFELLSNLDSNIDVMYLCNIENQYILDLKSNVKAIPIFNYSKYLSNFMRGISYCFSILNLLKILITFKPDIIHTQWPKIIKLDLQIIKFINFLKVPVVHTAHNILPHDDLKGKKFHTYQKYYKRLSGIIVHTEKSKEELVTKFKIGQQFICVNKHGFLKSKFNVAKRDKIINSLKENLRGKIIFSSLGFQSYYKGIDFIIDYWHSTGKDKSNIQLIIAGVCRYQRIAELSNYPNVIIMDKLLSNEELSALMKFTDVLLLPYLKISQSGILMSAIYDKTPFLVSDVGGLTEPLKTAAVGWNIGNPTLENFKMIMNQIIENPKQIEIIKNDNYAWYRLQDEYKWEIIAKRMLDFYNRIVNREIIS